MSVKKARDVVKIFGLVVVVVGIGVGLRLAQHASFFEPSSTATPSAPGLPSNKPKQWPSSGIPALKTEIKYKAYNLPSSIVHVLWIPARSQFVVTPVLVDGVETVETIAQKQGAIAALNGGFFDPENQQSTSFVTVQGKLVADPRLNKRLVSNPDLAPYLDKIFDRSEFRRYQCGEAIKYAIVRHHEPPLTNCQLIDALGGGPQLLYQDTALAEGFSAYRNGKLIRDSLGRRDPNARTAIGLTANGDVVGVMVAQKPNSLESGMSLEALTKFLQTLKISISLALNLDGGSSSSLYYGGNTFYGKLDRADKPVIRSVKSVLLVKMNR